MAGRVLKAIVFDIDGTLYRQTPLRRAMLFRLVAAHAANPFEGWRTMSALRAYRNAQEHLRGDASSRGDSPDNIATAQLRLASERSGIDCAALSACVERWMEREPLPLLSRCIQPGLREFLAACRERGLRLGALSDYPADAKLKALGVADYFDVSLCAQAPEIGVFKPDPKGLRVALERLGTDAADALYVGDRVDVDAAAAKSAGVACAIITRSSTPSPETHFVVESFAQLRNRIF